MATSRNLRSRSRATPAKAIPKERTRRPPARSTVRTARGRGDETRAELIEAALDVFGRLGYEGASTRVIAKAAGANLAAIVYHFGGKEALYLAVAKHVATSIFARVGPVLSTVTAPIAAGDRAGAHAALDRLVDTFVDLMIGSADAERWARFIIREQMEPTAAFDVIYRFMYGAATAATGLAATILGEPESERLRLRVITFIGQMLVFRVAETFVLRRMGWRSISDRQRREIKGVVKDNLTLILGRRTP